MKRAIVLVFAALFVDSGCRSSRGEVEWTTEDGIEVVLNRAAPDRAGHANPFSLSEIFRIDSEKTETRIPDIFGFDVSSTGDVFALKENVGGGDFIFKFDSAGRYVKSFGRKGQGPGELQNPHHIAMSRDDRLLVSDIGLGRVFEFDAEGTFVSVSPDERMIRMDAGPGGTRITGAVDREFDADKMAMIYSARLLDSSYKEIRDLDDLKVTASKTELPFPEPLLCWSASRDRAFVANESRGYEIRVFGPDGALVRKIRKDYTPLRISEEFKSKTLKPFPEPMRAAVRFPEFHTPFQGLAASDDGKLVVMTFEPGDRPGEFLFDVFDETGALRGRTSLAARVWEGHLWIKIKNGLLYVLREKPNGFREIAVSRIEWR